MAERSRPRTRPRPAPYPTTRPTRKRIPFSSSADGGAPPFEAPGGPSTAPGEAAYDSDVSMGSGSDSHDPDIEVAGPRGDVVSTLSFEDGHTAEVALMALIRPLTRFSGTTAAQRATYDALVLQSGFSSYLIEYLDDLEDSDRPDLEECFEMAATLIKNHGTAARWDCAWPIDAYLKNGHAFEGGWGTVAMLQHVAKWRDATKDLYRQGASRDEIGRFASLFVDLVSIGQQYLEISLPLFEVGSRFSVADYVDSMKDKTWKLIYQLRRGRWRTQKQQLLDQWGDRAELDIFQQFEDEMTDMVMDGTRLPLPPTEWAYRLRLAHIDAYFASIDPSAEEQAHYDGIRRCTEELFKRYGLMDMADPSDVSTPKAMCDALWDRIDAQSVTAVGLMDAQWKREIGNTTDVQERRKLQLRFALMKRHSKTGWCYGVKSPARPREYLWTSIETRLTDLGMPPGVRKSFNKMSDLAHILAGSGVLVEPPPLAYGTDAGDYVHNVLEAAFLEPEIEYWDLKWDEHALRESADSADRALILEEKDIMIADARDNGSDFSCPQEHETMQQWADLRPTFVRDDSPILAGQFNDLLQRVTDFAEMFGHFFEPTDLPVPSGDNDLDFGTLSAFLRARMDDLATDSYRNFRSVALNAAEMIPYNVLVDTLKANMASGGPFFRVWDPPADTDNDLDPRARGNGADRVGLEGDWRYAGHVGSGGFGQVSSWEKVDQDKNVLDRLVLKEAYVKTGWESQRNWDGDFRRRRPREYFVPKYLTDLPDSSSIVRPKAYAIYENLKMYRLYMEYCKHGDLSDTLKMYRSRNAGERMPERMLWSVFEALASALCIMRDGCLPGGTRPPTGGQTYERVMNLDLKNANIFLTDISPNEWPGIPKFKVGDFGLLCLEGDPGSDQNYGGTTTWKAPEQHNYDTLDVTSRFDRQPTSTATDVWGVGRIIMALMNGRSPAAPSTYAEGQPPLTFATGVRDFYSLQLRQAVLRCLASKPRDRTDCTQLWSDIQEHVTTPDMASGLAMKWRAADPQDNEVILFASKLKVTFKERAEDL